MCISLIVIMIPTPDRLGQQRISERRWRFNEESGKYGALLYLVVIRFLEDWDPERTFAVLPHMNC